MELRGKRQSVPVVSASKHKQTDVMQLYHDIASALSRFHRSWHTEDNTANSLNTTDGFSPSGRIWHSVIV